MDGRIAGPRPCANISFPGTEVNPWADGRGRRARRRAGPRPRPTVPGLIYGAPALTDFAASGPYFLVGAALGAFHLLLRPVLRLFSAPLGCLTLGLSGAAIDLGLIYLSARLVPGFAAPELLCAALTVGLINAVIAIVQAV